MTKLSIVMPVFNEAATVLIAMGRVLDVDYPCATEVVVVDDGSGDATWDLLQTLTDPRIRLVQHERNQGKGAAVRTGVANASGTHLIILDADLEYAPADIPAMLAPVLDGISDHVFGVRVFGLNTRYPSFRFAMGGRATTLAANIMYDSCLTDMHTCLKLLPIAHFRALDLHESGFGLDTELTARLLRAGVRPYEVPVSYNGRGVTEGKKITWRDGVRCLAVLGRVRVERSQTMLEPVWAPTAVPDQHTAVVSERAEAEPVLSLIDRQVV